MSADIPSYVRLVLSEPAEGTEEHIAWVLAVEARWDAMTEEESNEASAAVAEAYSSKPKHRTSIGKKLRFDVFKRDGFVCAYCGAHPPQVTLEVDHIRPVAEGGGNEDTNLITSCFNCNRGKSATSLTDVPRSLSDRAMEVAEREEQIAGYEAVMRGHRERVEQDAQEILEIFCDHYRREGISKNDFRSIHRFIVRLGLHEVTEAAESAMAKVPYNYNGGFRYFCGICWAKIRENEAAV